MKMKKSMRRVALILAMLLFASFLLADNPARVFADAGAPEVSDAVVTGAEQIGFCNGNLVIVSESSTVPLALSCSLLDVSGGLFSNIAVDADLGRKIVTPQGHDLYTYNIFEEIFNRADGFEYHAGSYQIGGNTILANDYAEEDLGISGQKISCGSFLGASENLMLSASQIKNGNAGQPMYIMAVNGGIQINADRLDLNGLIYAPNGKVEINANQIDFRGIIIANEVIIRANRVSLKAKDIDIPIEMYSTSPADVFTGDIMMAGYVGGSSTSSSSSKSYYYNTGGYGSNSAKYNRYKLIQRIKVGDLVYEAAGFYGLTGHIAVVHKFIVHPIYIYHGDSFAGSYSVTQIQVIEAISEGVCFGLLDDTRCDEKEIAILRASQLTDSKWKKIRGFLEKQLGKPYNFDLGRKAGSINRPCWYCSELAWAAFYYAGIDIDRKEYGEPGVTPHDINNNSDLIRINYK